MDIHTSAGEDPHASTQSVPKLLLIVGFVCILHVAALGFWVYKYTTSSDKRTSEFANFAKQSKD